MQELYAGEVGERYMVLIVSPDEQEDILEEIQVSLERKKLAMLYADNPEGLAELRIVGELPDYLVHTLESVRPGDTNETLAGAQTATNGPSANSWPLPTAMRPSSPTKAFPRSSGSEDV